MTKESTPKVATKSVKSASSVAANTAAKINSVNPPSNITNFPSPAIKESSMSQPGQSSSNAYNSFANAANKASSAFSGNAEEASAIFKANTDALMQSAQRAMTACNQICQSLMSFSQSIMQMNVAAIQAATNARTLRDVTEIQNDCAKSVLDACVSKGSEISELALKAANDAAAPISARINETMQEFSKQRSAA